MKRFSSLASLALFVAQRIAGQHVSSGSFDNVAMLQSVTNGLSSSSRAVSEGDETFIARADSRADSKRVVSESVDSFIAHSSSDSDFWPFPSKADTVSVADNKADTKVLVTIDAAADASVGAVDDDSNKPQNAEDAKVDAEIGDLLGWEQTPPTPRKHFDAKELDDAFDTDAEASVDADADVDAEVVNFWAAGAEADDAEAEHASVELDTSVEETVSGSDAEGDNVLNDNGAEIDTESDAGVHGAVLMTTDTLADAAITKHLDAADSANPKAAPWLDAIAKDVISNYDEGGSASMVMTGTESDAADTANVGDALHSIAKDVISNFDSAETSAADDESAGVDAISHAATDSEAWAVVEHAITGLDASADDMTSEVSDSAIDNAAELDAAFDAKVDALVSSAADVEVQVVAAQPATHQVDTSAHHRSASNAHTSDHHSGSVDNAHFVAQHSGSAHHLPHPHHTFSAHKAHHGMAHFHHR